MKIRRSPACWRAMARRCGARIYRWAENNDDTRAERNGEQWFARALLRAHARDRGRPTVLDVGANVGAYTEMLLAEADVVGVGVKLHLFEPSVRCCESLRQQFGGMEQVRIVPMALGDQRGAGLLHHGGEGSAHASLVARPLLQSRPASDVQVPIQRLDTYLAETGIERVALLKLDVEGYELAVLRGAGERLRPSVIDAIQFEYGGTTQDAGTSLQALHGLLTSRGYLVGKLFPNEVELRDFAPWMETFSYANYVALAPRWLEHA